jgi:MerR family regulatory protein.
MDKSPDAFRTISEVSEFLETPAHVLRFWESRFPQTQTRQTGRRAPLLSTRRCGAADRDQTAAA